jgi:selenide,water dikinase
MELGHVLAALPPLTDPNVLAGSLQRDDAAIYRLGDRGIVATVDFFTPIVDDPTAFGAIAAANSLSDVYAVGGKPLFALGLVAFPRDKLEAGVLEAIVAGGAAKLAEAGVPVVGGHSVDDSEPKVGYAVLGEVDPERRVGHDGAQAGDAIYLTKPLGSGLVATAIKQGVCPPALEQAAIGVMTHLNAAAAAAMLAAGVRAATDVTGYGLIGHLANLAAGAEIQYRKVPFLPGVADLAMKDLFPSGSRRNHEAYRDQVDWGGLDLVDQLLLCDAQTSGGLLVCLPPENAAGFETALAGGPYQPARIGEVTGDGSIRVRP